MYNNNLNNEGERRPRPRFHREGEPVSARPARPRFTREGENRPKPAGFTNERSFNGERPNRPFGAKPKRSSKFIASNMKI